jgi:hypothetical protein
MKIKTNIRAGLTSVGGVTVKRCGGIVRVA